MIVRNPTRELPAWLDAAGWVAEPDRGRLTLVDEVVLGPVRLLILAGAGDQATLYFAPVLADGRDACRHAGFDHAVVQAMRAGLTRSTRAGHTVEFRGAPAAYTRPLPFDPGWSSNSLSLMDLGGTAHAHKTYRRITPGSREPRLLRAMSGSGRTQQPIGEYVYGADAGSVPLGMIYVYADGDGLDVPLRGSLRLLWPALAAGVPARAAVAAVLTDLAEPLMRAGAFLRGCHEELARRLGPCPAIRVDAFIAETRVRLAGVAAAIRADDRLPVEVRRAAIDALHAGWTHSAAATRSGWPAGASHGDLHLSHFLRAERADGTWRMCLIDLSTPAFDPADPRYAAQSPWQDPVALVRGLACFTGDEYAYQAGLELDVDSAEVCRAALLRAAGSPPDGPDWTGSRLALLGRLRRAAALWQRQVGELLLRGYSPDAGITGHPAWRMFQLRRLLHELAYAYAHDRAYYAAITLRHVIEIAADHASGR